MSLPEQYPGGCFVVFNWSIDRQASAQFVDFVAFAHNNGVREIHLMISSDGGLVIDAHQLLNTLAGFPITFITYNANVVQSAANLIYALGARRVAMPGSTFFFHQTSFPGVTGQRVSETQIRRQLQAIEEEDARSARFISSKTGVAFDLIQTWQRQEQTLTAEEAVAAGIALEVRDPVIPPDAFVKQILVPK